MITININTNHISTNMMHSFFYSMSNIENKEIVNHKNSSMHQMLLLAITKCDVILKIL